MISKIYTVKDQPFEITLTGRILIIESKERPSRALPNSVIAPRETLSINNVEYTLRARIPYERINFVSYDDIYFVRSWGQEPTKSAKAKIIPIVIKIIADNWEWIDDNMQPSVVDYLTEELANKELEWAKAVKMADNIMTEMRIINLRIEDFKDKKPRNQRIVGTIYGALSITINKKFVTIKPFSTLGNGVLNINGNEY